MNDLDSLQEDTLHSNHASLSDYYVPGSISIAIPIGLVIPKASDIVYNESDGAFSVINTGSLVYNESDGTYSVNNTSSLVYEDSYGTWTYTEQSTPVRSVSINNDTTPKLPDNPLPDTPSETPALPVVPR